jgi:hypothetical protein
VVSRGGFCRLENDQEEGATHDLERIRPFEDSPCLQDESLARRVSISG